MAEEFQAGVCSGIWWNSSRSSVGLSPCLISINDAEGFGWPSGDFVEMKGRNSISTTDESAGSVAGGGLLDSTSQMMGIGLSSSSSSTITQDWNQTLLIGRGGSERNFHCSMLQEDLNSRMNFRKETGNPDCPQIQEWNSNIDESKQTNQGFSVDQGLLPPTSGFPMSSASYCGVPSALLQTLFDSDSPPQQSLFDNRPMNYQPNFNEISPSIAKLLGPSLPKEQPISDFPLTSSTSFWNASTAALNDITASVFPPTQPPQLVASIFEEKPNCPNPTAKTNNEAVQDSLVSKSGSEPAFKRARIETPSPLPTFKVRKEKLGDRVTALQQLVSPFGKTDTASVLHEAIEYIKYLHEQVSVLSTPYMKNGAPNIQHQQDNKGSEQDLKSRGLCLVPISSTYPVANETTADLWMTAFGGTFR